MEIHVDRFGRVVIPKEVRIHLGLRTGSVLDVEEHEQEVLLRPVREAPHLLLKDGVLVFSGTAAGALPEAIRAHRADRVRQVTRRLRR